MLPFCVKDGGWLESWWEISYLGVRSVFRISVDMKPRGKVYFDKSTGRLWLLTSFKFTFCADWRRGWSNAFGQVSVSLGEG